MLSASKTLKSKTYLFLDGRNFFGYLFLVSEPFDEILNHVIHLILHAPLKVIDILLDGPLLNQLKKLVELFVEEVLKLVNLPIKLLNFF